MNKCNNQIGYRMDGHWTWMNMGNGISSTLVRLKILSTRLFLDDRPTPTYLFFLGEKYYTYFVGKIFQRKDEIPNARNLKGRFIYMYFRKH